eukprot:TRINITY_DN11170_c0_g2_i19.p2 TRINITY_DN11170_c0_g2~~TRINITY_DN11170_c0_g2_i19.p2  ORF type:complete len:127 (+),score=29.43 TRINITY_DN11170_c0_g2_i19:95-475(+)
MGRIVYYSLEKNVEKEIVDIKNEMVRAITLSPDGSHYHVANGDLGWYDLPEDALTAPLNLNAEPKGNHSDICERSYTFQAKSYNCVIILAGEEDSTDSKERLRCRFQSVPGRGQDCAFQYGDQAYK